MGCGSNNLGIDPDPEAGGAAVGEEKTAVALLAFLQQGEIGLAAVGVWDSQNHGEAGGAGGDEGRGEEGDQLVRAFLVRARFLMSGAGFVVVEGDRVADAT